MPYIRPLESGDSSLIETAAWIVRTAFEPFALAYGITRDNCASFPAFFPDKQLDSALKAPRVHGYAIYDGAEMIGFYMLRCIEEDNLLDISRLAVLPNRQGEGIGSFALENIYRQGRALRVPRLHISIVDENEQAKEWLAKRGFVQTGRLKYPRLPYRMAFLEKRIG